MLSIVTPSKITSANVDDVKEHLRLNTQGEERYLEVLIQTATNLVENMTGRSLLKKTYRFVSNGHGELELPKVPLIDILEIYSLDPKRIVKRYKIDRSKPYAKLLYHAPLGTIDVIYEAGYGDLPSSIPTPLRHAVLTLCADLYENRGQAPSLSSSLLKSLLEPYVVKRSIG